MATSGTSQNRSGQSPKPAKLSLSPAEPSLKVSKAPKQEVADSWEDEDISDEEPEPPTPASAALPLPSAPPPTPATPTYGYTQEAWTVETQAAHLGVPREADFASRRPEKTDAVARRMIAASLGVKVPKMTDEQKQYQKTIKEQELRKREQQKLDEAQRQLEAQKAKAAIWED